MDNFSPRFELRLLGPPELRLADAVVTGWRQPRLLNLLAYVAMEGTVGRNEVAALLWPDTAAVRAVANLRQLLYLSRKHAGARLWECAGENLRLSANLTCDARRLLDAIETDYPGEFLAGLTFPEGPFQDWVENVRRRCRDQAEQLLLRSR